MHAGRLIDRIHDTQERLILRVQDRGGRCLDVYVREEDRADAASIWGGGPVRYEYRGRKAWLIPIRERSKWPSQSQPKPTRGVDSPIKERREIMAKVYSARLLDRFELANGRLVIRAQDYNGRIIEVAVREPDRADACRLYGREGFLYQYRGGRPFFLADESEAE